MKKKILLLGIGNEILGDDAVGIKVGEHFERLNLPIDVGYAGITGLRLIDYIQGYEKVIIVDALEITHTSISDYSVRVFEQDDLLDDSLFHNIHDTSLGMALKLAKNSSYTKFPDIVKLIAIEIPFQREYSDELSEHTKKLLNEAITVTTDLLGSFGIKKIV
ncbi:MAG: hydrogenase maturation protease [Candidatus Hodarchaeales archaeon]